MKQKRDMHTEVVIVGGGLAGIWCAYELAKAGKKVIVVEKDTVGNGATKYTTAFITHAIDTDLPSLADLYGKDKAKMVWDSGRMAINKIQEVVINEKIDCNFMICPAYVYATEARQYDELNNEKEVAKELGYFMDVRTDPLLRFDNYGYGVLEHQAKYDAHKFISVLAKLAKKKGALIYENSEVRSINGKGPVEIKLKKGYTITADDVIIATYDPFTHPFRTMAKKGFYESYVLQIELERGILKEGVYWDKCNPYHYFRVDSQDAKTDLMTLGGADHKNLVPISAQKNFKALEEHFKKILPDIKNYRIKKKWSGPILEPSDGIALIGEYKPHYYVASAFSGNGMTYAPMSAVILRDLILKVPNEWSELYDPKRSRNMKRYIKKGRDYVEEFIEGALKNSFK